MCYPLHLEFFEIFSRLENLVKRKGYFKKRNNSGDIQIEWNKFADHIEPIFDNFKNKRKELNEAVDYIIKYPPKKLVVKHFCLCWKDTPASQGSSVRNLIVYLRRIRNNLFHGEKTLIGGEITDDRDVILLKYGVEILRTIYEMIEHDMMETYGDEECVYLLKNEGVPDCNKV